jgi:hypothetical protein
MYIIIGVIVWLLLLVFILRIFAVSKPIETENPVADRSVNCYFCNELAYESDCISADDYNNYEGGCICPRCTVRIESLH